MDLVIYHAKCPDGFCAAYIAKKKYPEAELLGLDHGEPVPFDRVKDKDVLVVDFSWPNREDNIKLNEIAKSFHIYDHHKTAQERLVGLDFVTFDMNRSGAGITWDELLGGPRAWYVDYVEDRDLWLHKLPGSKAVSAYIMCLPMTIEAWDRLNILKVEHAEQFGLSVLSHIDRYVLEAVEEAQYGFLDIPDYKESYTAAIVNLPYMNCSEVGNVLANKAQVGITWFERADNQIQFSLRSEGGIDVGHIAMAFFGGGHKHAAGFRMSVKAGRAFIDGILNRND